MNLDDYYAHGTLGDLLRVLQRYNEAEKECKEVIRINPQYVKAHYDLGNLLYILQNTMKLRKNIERQ